MKQISLLRKAFSVLSGLIAVQYLLPNPQIHLQQQKHPPGNSGAFSELLTGACKCLVGSFWFSVPPCTRGTAPAWPLNVSFNNMFLLNTSHFFSPRKIWTFLECVLRATESKTSPSLLLITFLPYCHLLWMGPCQHSWWHCAATYRWALFSKAWQLSEIWETNIIFLSKTYSREFFHVTPVMNDPVFLSVEPIATFFHNICEQAMNDM